MSAPTRQPPLWTWAATAVLVAAVLGLIALADAAVRPDIAARRLNLPRIDAAQRADPRGGHAYRIVILGSSKTRCAVDFDSDMEARLRAAGLDAEFVRVTVSGAGWHELAPAFAHLEKTRPDLVLVEADLVLFEPEVYRLIGQPRPSWMSRVRGDLGFLLHAPKLENLTDAGRSACDLSLYQGGKPITLDQYARAIARRRVSTPSERAPFLDALAQLQARGARVGLLLEPRSPEAERAFPPALRRDARALADRLGRERGYVLVEPRAEVPGDAFIDVGHMNADGRGRFSTALARALAGLFPARPPRPERRGG